MRQVKQRGALTQKPEPVSLEDTMLAVSQNHEVDVDPSLAADLPTPVVKKAPRPVRMGTRFSARLRGNNPAVVHEPTQTRPEIKQAKGKRGSGVKEDTIAERGVDEHL